MQSTDNRNEIDRIWKSLDTLTDSLKEISIKLDAKFETLCDRVNEVKVQVTETSVKLHEIAGNGKPGKLQEMVNKQEEQEKKIDKLNNQWAKVTGICIGVTTICSIIAWMVEILIHHADTITSVIKH